MQPNSGPVPAPISSAFLSVFQSAASEHPGLIGATHAATAWLDHAAVRLEAPAGLAEDAWICARLGLAWMQPRARGDDASAAPLLDDLKGAGFRRPRPRNPDGSLAAINQALLDDFAPSLAGDRIAAWFHGERLDGKAMT